MTTSPVTKRLATKRLALVVGLALGTSFDASRAANASIVMALDLPALVQQADHIALVDVVSQRSDWDVKHERILSTIDLKVVERWKGQVSSGEDRITIVQPGGTVGDLTMTVTGLSTFTPGERALVFLRGTTASAHVLGLSQGKRLVRYETASKKWLVHAPDLRQTTLVKPPVASPVHGTSAAQTVRALPGVRETGLDDFRAEVKALLALPATK